MAGFVQSAEPRVPRGERLQMRRAMQPRKGDEGRRVVAQLCVVGLQQDALGIGFEPVAPRPGDRGDRRRRAGSDRRLRGEIDALDSSQRIEEQEPVEHRRGPERRPLDLRAVIGEPVRQEVAPELLDRGVQPGSGIGGLVAHRQGSDAE